MKKLYDIMDLYIFIENMILDNKNLLLNKDSIINAAKIYILRYCYNDYEKDDEILKNFDIKK